MIKTTTGCFIKPLEIVKIEIVNNRIDHTDRIVRRYVLINSAGKKNRLVGSVIPKVCFCGHLSFYFLL